MFLVKAYISLSVNPMLVYNLLLDVANYPSLFPFYVKVNDLGQNVWKIKALMHIGVFSQKGKVFEWRTRIIKKPEEFIIETDELNPKFPLKYLHASWQILEGEVSMQLILKHEFEIAGPIILKYILYPIIYFIIRKNSYRLLNNIHNHLKSHA